MRYLVPLLFLGLSACHLPPSASAASGPWGYDPGPATRGAGPGWSTGSGWSSGPLRAAVTFDEYTGQAAFDLSRPAHVAVFAMRPFGAVEMIYPRWGWEHDSRRAFDTGHHRVRTDSRLYHLAGNRSGYGRSVGSAGQTYIVLIASDRPLELGPLMATGRAYSLEHPAITWNPFVATGHLAREIGAGHGGAEWTAAYHVVWHQDRLRRDRRVPYTTVRCPGGSVISVPTEAVRSGAWRCPDPRRPPTTDARPRPEAPPITRALPKRPRPTGWSGATPAPVDAPAGPDARPAKRPRGTTRPEAVPGRLPRQPAVRRPAPERKPAAPTPRKPKKEKKPRPGGGGGGDG